jgi:hypothetical protein
MAETLTYAQGQTATLTATFTNTVGMNVDVPDATFSVFGTGGTPIVTPSPMSKLYTGFYFFDWAIPNSLPVNTYTALITGTVQGIPNAMTTYVTVVGAGTGTAVSATQREIGMIDALNSYIGSANRITVKNQVATRDETKRQFFFTWPRWNLGAQVRRNGNVISSGYTLDYSTGLITFEKAQHETDKVSASYNFKWFTDNEMLRFLNDALSQMNIEAPGTTFTLETVPDPYVGTLMQGAIKNAMMQIIISTMFQEPATVFGDMDRLKFAMDNAKTIKENAEKQFERDKKQVKRARYPATYAVVQPEYALPGGRSRWFRYLFSSNVS